MLLTWRTASERNSARWHIERSANGQVFERIGTQEAAGTTTRPTAYAFRDDQPTTSSSHQLTTSPSHRLTYYRLRQEDDDGKVSYSPVRSLRRTAAALPALALFPNPARTAVTVQGAAEAAPVRVSDALGRPVASGTTDAVGTARLALPAGLPAGVYVVRCGAQVARLTVE